MKDFLKDKQLLLVLDNFEHVVEAAPVVSELLARSSGLNVLTTSPIPLRLYGEHTLFVPPLALPDRRVTQLPQNLVRCESVRLFVERSPAAKTDFTLRGHQPTA